MPAYRRQGCLSSEHDSRNWTIRADTRAHARGDAGHTAPDWRGAWHSSTCSRGTACCTGPIYLCDHSFLLPRILIHQQRFFCAERRDEFKLAVAASLSSGGDVGIARRLTATLDVHVDYLDGRR